MLSDEDNRMLTRTGPGTPMGDLFRSYWLPVLLSEQVQRDGAPVRLKSARTAETRIVLLLLNYKLDPATLRMAGEIIGARDIDFADPSAPPDRVDRDIYAGDTVEPLHILYDVEKNAPAEAAGGGAAARLPGCGASPAHSSTGVVRGAV